MLSQRCRRQCSTPQRQSSRSPSARMSRKSSRSTRTCPCSRWCRHRAGPHASEHLDLGAGDAVQQQEQQEQRQDRTSRSSSTRSITAACMPQQQQQQQRSRCSNHSKLASGHPQRQAAGCCGKQRATKSSCNICATTAATSQQWQQQQHSSGSGSSNSTAAAAVGHSKNAGHQHQQLCIENCIGCTPAGVNAACICELLHTCSSHAAAIQQQGCAMCQARFS